MAGLLFLWLFAAAGCGTRLEPAAPTKSKEDLEIPDAAPSEPSHNEAPRTVTDSLHRKVTLPRRPERIVSLAPKNTEELFAVGAGDRVVGVTSYCNYPPESREREKIGGFSSKSISLEKIVSLQPELVVAAGRIHEPIIAELDRLDIPVVALGAESFDELFRELKMLGTLVGREKATGPLIERLRSRVRAIQEIAETIKPEKRVTAFYLTWDEPLTAAGPASYVGQMIEICGGANIISDASSQYPQISLEVLIDRNPDVILAASMGSMRRSVESLRAKPDWSNLKAVRNNRVYLLDSDLVSRCGPRLVDALEDMAHALYPERFAERAEAKNARLHNPEGDSLP
ncbi:MAG: ABC transporter substrate-binding protein [Acidobacteria bacterium]|nr:ABC transporter substrate-binding protein [Acidobacteriota bacterium]